jgi:hypothetical protein
MLARCPRCNIECEFHPILALTPPDESYWACPDCGPLLRYDDAGHMIDYTGMRTETHIVAPGTQGLANFVDCETMGQCYYSPWALSRVPGWLRALEGWKPFGWAMLPLRRLGLLYDLRKPGVVYMAPRWLAAIVFWRPLSGMAHRLWTWLGKPGFLAKVDLT